MVKELFNTQLTDITTSAKDTVGDVRFENGNWYKYVKIMNHTATVAGVAGDPVAYYAVTGHSIGRVVIDISDADAVPICAGYLMGTITGTLDTAYYGWIQLTGDVTVPTAITSGVVGTPVYLTTGDKTLAKLVDTNATVALVQCGIETSATAANNTIIATCPF